MTAVLANHQLNHPSGRPAVTNRSGLLLETPLPGLLDARLAQVNLRSAISQVNANGSFEFDKVLKTGKLLKRTKRTKTWKKVHVVLRPHSLSIYRNSQESKLRAQIDLSEITAVAPRKDRKGREEHTSVFGLFSPSKNYYFDAGEEAAASEWIKAVRAETGIDTQDRQVPVVRNVVAPQSVTQPRTIRSFQPPIVLSHFNAGEELSSSPETMPPGGTTQQIAVTRSMQIPRGQRPQPYGLSSHDYASQSDGSVVFGSARSSFSQSFSPGPHGAGNMVDTPISADVAPIPAINLTPSSPFVMDERVLWHGFLHCMRFRRGVRHWKKYWVVLRNKQLALYKGQEEYAALLIIPLPSILDVVEVDALSKSKRFCMQVITDDRSYRFCAKGEDELSRWLGSFKSLLTKKAAARPAEPSS